jgi:hypothetical protein
VTVQTDYPIERLLNELPPGEVLPIVREVRALGAVAFDGDRDVLGIYPEGVVVYRRSGSHPAVLPLAYHQGGWNAIASARSKGSKAILRWEEIASVRVSSVQFYGNRVLAGRERGRWFRFTTADNRYAEVFLSEHDAELPCAVLRRLAPSMQVDAATDSAGGMGRRLSSPPHSFLLRVLIASTLINVLGNVLFAVNRDWLILMVAILPAGMVSLVGWPCVIGRALFASPTHYARAQRQRRRANRTVRANRQPLHSPLGGTLLKLGAVLLGLGAVYLQFSMLERPKQFPGNQYWSGLLFLPAAMMAHFGHRISRLPASQLLVKDRRAPILYLRAFVHDDTGNYNPDGWLSRVLGCKPLLPRALGGAANPLLPNIVRMVLGRATEVAEEQFATGLRGFGPLVAVGRPGELVQAGGAARLYLGEHEWQTVVLDLMASSQLIVAEAGTGDHLWWEIEQASRRYIDKLVVSFRGINGDQAAHDDFRLRFMLERGVPLPRCARALMFVVVRNGMSYLVPEFRHAPILWPVVGTAVDFRRVFSHIRGFVPGAGATPVAEVGASFPAAASAIIAWNLLLGSILYVLWIAVAGLIR